MKKLLSLILAVTPFVTSWGQNSDNDREIRLNPDMSGNNAPEQSSQINYPFINISANHIDMNGDNWDELRNKLAQTTDGAIFTIVHIGDSHVQPDGNTGKVRNLLQNDYGNAGRGLIAPLRIAGTNEPLDYKLTTSSPVTTARLLNQPWAVNVGVTGVAMHLQQYKGNLDVQIKSPCGYFTVLSHGHMSIDGIRSHGKPVAFETEETTRGVEVYMEDDCTEFTLSITAPDADIYGLDLRNDSSGIVYHAIGNNGATFASYAGIPGFYDGIAALQPDLIILSLGTNEAFGRVDAEVFRSQVSSTLEAFKRSCPEAKLLLTTPAECQRSVYTSRRSGKGRKRSRTKSYSINDKVAHVGKLIKDIALQNHIPVYDFYKVAGGYGSSNKWRSAGLLSADRIHRTWDGYRVEGSLFYQALVQAIK